MTQTILALLFVLSAQPTGADDLFFARGMGSDTTARVFDHNILGPTIQIGLLGHSLRGRAWGAKADLVWDGERVVGQAGGARVDLKYRAQDDGGLEVEGVYAGSPIHLAFGAATIVGQIDRHRVALAGAEGVFGGDGIEVDIPAALTSREAGERAAVLPILIAGVTRAARPPIDHSRLFRFEPPEGWPTARSPDVSFRPSALPYFIGAGGPNPPNPMSDRRRE